MVQKRKTKKLTGGALDLPTPADEKCQLVPADALAESRRSQTLAVEPDWCTVLMEQLAEHGINRITNCPNDDAYRDERSESPLARKILRILRHVPEEAALRMDRDGWVHAPQLGEAINAWCQSNTRWQACSLAPLMREIGLNDRIQFDGEWCRASYGHSTRFYQPTTFAVPTQPLFHGTGAEKWGSIECFGLAPMQRRFVQLTTDFSYAEHVAAKSKAPLVLQILREQAIADRIQFVATGTHVWLAEAIPPHLLQGWLSDCWDMAGMHDRFANPL